MCAPHKHDELKLEADMIWHCRSCDKKWPKNSTPVIVLEKY